MDPNEKEVSPFQALPRDLIGVILTKIGATSPPDFNNTIRSCKEIYTSADTKQVYRCLSIALLVRQPLASYGYNKTMEKCLANDNPEANYVKGLLMYFHEGDFVTGLSHFRLAAEAGHKEATYIYDVLLLCNGMTEQCKQFFAQLNWDEDTTTVDACWRNIKASLHGIMVGVRGRYLRNMHNMQPPNTCHLNDMDTTCSNCFHYRRMKKFVYMM